MEMVDSLLSPLPLHWTRHRGLDRQAHQSDRHNRQRHQKSRKSQTKSSEAQRQPALHVTASPGSPGISPTLHRHQLETTDILNWSSLMAGHHHDASSRIERMSRCVKKGMKVESARSRFGMKELPPKKRGEASVLPGEG